MRFSFSIASIVLLFIGPTLLYSQDQTLSLSKIVLHSPGEKALEMLLEEKNRLAIKPDHPDYPIFTTISALLKSTTDGPLSIIEMLESTLEKSQFKGVYAIDEQKSEIVVGFQNSSSRWRDLLFLVLARAYFESEQLNKAKTYYESIPTSSIYAPLVYLELGWTYLRLEEIENAEKNFTKLALIPTRKEGKQEIELQRSFLLLLKKNFSQAITLAEGVQLAANAELVTLRLKILAQGHFMIYLQEINSLSFSQKINKLEHIIQLAGKVPVDQQDPSFAFLMSEAYWHLASVYRIKDPVEYQSVWEKNLQMAYSSLSPWVQKSLADKKSWLSEEAMFFSIALLWEKSEFKEAIVTLKAFPQLFPLGEFREDVYQLLGDYYYDQGEFSSAIIYYRNLSQNGDPDKAAYGVYKAAWCFYSLKEHWKALRHFERLLLHYFGEEEKSAESLNNFATTLQPHPPAENDLQAKEEPQKNKKGVFFNETINDFLIILAELVPSGEAIAELKFLNQNEVVFLNITERLALTYHKIGQYQESSKVWIYLLQNHKDHSHGANWLMGLAEAQFSGSLRGNLAENLEKFLPQIAKTFKPESEKELQQLISKIILSWHREANKSDDTAIWKVVDQLYSIYDQNFPLSQEGTLWFHGAQRKEQKDELIPAITWYKKSAANKTYDLREEAHHSVLRIAQGHIEKLSLSQPQLKPQKMEVSKDEIAPINNSKFSKLSAQERKELYQKISQEILWYLQFTGELKQKELAEFIYLESLYHGEERKIAQEYLLHLLEKEGFTKPHLAQFEAHFARLYSDEKWEEANTLVGQILQMVEKNKPQLPSESFASLENYYQETAFQLAFSLDKNTAKTRTEKELADLRKWYKLSLKHQKNQEVTLKSWHNLSLTFSTINDEFRKTIEDFEKQYHHEDESTLKLGEKERSLISEVYTHTSKLFQQQSHFLLQAKFLSLAAYFNPNLSQKEAQSWSALVIFGSYHDLPSMQKEFSLLKKVNGKILEKSNYLETYARLNFLNGEFTRSWEYLQEVLQRPEPSPLAWTLLRDLFFIAEENKLEFSVVMKKFLKSNEKKLQKRDLLRPLWSSYYKSELQGLLNKYLKADSDEDLIIDRDEAGASREPANKVDKDFEEKISKIKNISLRLQREKSQLSQYVKDWMPAVALEAICHFSPITLKAKISLEKLAEGNLQEATWTDFQHKLKEKQNELDELSKKEVEKCDQEKQAWPFLNFTASCEHFHCFGAKKVNTDEISKIVKETEFEKFSPLEKFNRYLELGAYAQAESFTYSLQPGQLRTLLLALLRLSLQDIYSASLLLEDIKIGDEHHTHANLILAQLAVSNQSWDLALEKIKLIKEDKLFPFQKNLLAKLISGLPEAKKADLPIEIGGQVKGKKNSRD